MVFLHNWELNKSPPLCVNFSHIFQPKRSARSKLCKIQKWILKVLSAEVVIELSHVSKFLRHIVHFRNWKLRPFFPRVMLSFVCLWQLEEMAQLIDSLQIIFFLTSFVLYNVFAPREPISHWLLWKRTSMNYLRKRKRFAKKLVFSKP